jgi:histidinol-phosphate phosphatase family protein
MTKGSVVIIGPGHPLRGGLATFDQRLAVEFIQEGYDCRIYSFSLQYPSFLFPGTTQYSTEPPPAGLTILSRINSINPLNWLIVGNELRKMRPDIIVVRYWLPFMGPALGTILRRVRKSDGRKSDRRPSQRGANGPTGRGADGPTGHTRIIAITDNILPHEKRPGDTAFTRYFLKSCDAFITMSEKVLTDLRQFEKAKPARQVTHPLYDNFGEPVSKEPARAALRLKTGLEIADTDKLILFFGFIRRYKGLDILLDAMADERVRAEGIKLLIAGEFYEDEKPYLEQIDRLGIRNALLLRTDFIPDSEVKYYLCAADAVIQPYRNATQSGVTPLAYHFEKPMIVSNVGGLPSLVPHKIAGLVAQPESGAMAAAILEFYRLGEGYFIPNIRKEKEKYSWSRLVGTILDLAVPAKESAPALDSGLSAPAPSAPTKGQPAALFYEWGVNETWTLFLDRDGVINEEKEQSYVFRYDEFVFYEGVLEALRLLTGRFAYFVVVTNQRGVGKGLMTADDLRDIHQKMTAAIVKAGGRIDRVYYCDSLSDEHPNRKPNPGMAFEAIKDLPGIDLTRSIMVGNNISDMEFGKNAGMHTVFLRTTNPDQSLPHASIDLSFDSLLDFAKALQG